MHRDNPCERNPLALGHLEVEDEDDAKLGAQPRRVARKIEIREARDKRARWKRSLLSVKSDVFRGTRRTLHAIVKTSVGGFDGEFDGVQGNFAIHQAEYPRVCITGGTSLAVSSRPLMRSWLCLPSLSLSFSLVLSCRASRCRKRVLLAALPKKRYKTGAS